METLYHFIMTSPSGYQFRTVYSLHWRNTDQGQRRNLSGTLYVGNPKTNNKEEACTTITVTYPDSITEYEERYKRESLLDPTIARLILAKHYASCAEDRNLIKGDGTKEMVRCAMSYVKKLCPFVNEFELHDSSIKECDNHSSITLPYLYITNKGTTWYAYVFKAHLKGSLQSTYEKAVNDMMDSPLEEFEDFSIRYMRNISQVVRGAVEKSYRKSTINREFFHYLYKDNTVNMAAILLQGWIDLYMTDMKLDEYVMRHKWYIDANADTFPVYSFPNRNKTLSSKTVRKNKTVKRREIWNRSETRSLWE